MSVHFILFSVRIDQVLRSLLPDPIKQEQLVVENTPDPLAGEQVSLIRSLTEEGGSWYVLLSVLGIHMLCDASIV